MAERVIMTNFSVRPYIICYGPENKVHIYAGSLATRSNPKFTRTMDLDQERGLLCGIRHGLAPARNEMGMEEMSLRLIQKMFLRVSLPISGEISPSIKLLIQVRLLSGYYYKEVVCS